MHYEKEPISGRPASLASRDDYLLSAWSWFRWVDQKASTGGRETSILRCSTNKAMRLCLTLRISRFELWATRRKQNCGCDTSKTGSQAAEGSWAAWLVHVQIHDTRPAGRSLCPGSASGRLEVALWDSDCIAVSIFIAGSTNSLLYSRKVHQVGQNRGRDDSARNL